MNLFKTLFAAALLAFAAFAFAAEPVNINYADVDELTQLHGIGPAKAEAIIEYRENNGPFLQVEDLANVKGIGLATVERNRDMIVVGRGGQR